MLPRADLNLNRPPASLEAATRAVPSADARLEVFQRLNQIAIGKELQATVNSALDDGTYLVKIADAAARMALPVGTKVGDQLSLIFIAREPKPTFLLMQQGGSAVTSLSDAGRLIDQLLHAAQQDGAPEVRGRSPLLGSPADGQRIALALQDSLASSGLFYESHLSDWVNGSRPLSDLAREPQAQLDQATDHRRSSGTPGETDGELARLANSMRDLGDGAQKLAKMIMEARLQPTSGRATDADLIARAQSALPPLSPEAARLVNLQLHALEHQHVRWKGELWPGQAMEWEISEDKPDGGSPEARQSNWSSVVRFELPNLGHVAATIHLTDGRVRVQVNTADEDAAQTLRAHGKTLANALDAAGSSLDSFLVKRDEEP